MEEKRLINKKHRASRQNNLTQLANCCNQMGAFYLGQGQYEESLENFKEELSLYDEEKDQAEIGSAHRMIGEVCLQMNELKEAEKHIKKFLNISIKLKSKIDEERAHTTQGRLRLAQAEQSNDDANKLKLLGDAKESFLIALNMCKDLSGVSNTELKDMEARLYINIGLAEDVGNNSAAVLQNLQKALDIGRRYDLTDVCFLSHFNMALAHKSDLKRAYHCASLAADVAEKFENCSTKLVDALLLKAMICIQMEKYEIAKRNLKKAYRLKTKVQDVSRKIEKKLKIVIVIIQTERLLRTIADENYSEKRNLNEKLGDASCCLKNFRQAIHYYSRALTNAEMCGENLCPLYVSLYNTYRDLKEYDKAIEYMQKELHLNANNSIEAFKTIIDMVDVHRESIDKSDNLVDDKFWQIDELLERAENEAKKLHDTKLMKDVFMRKIELREFYKKNTLAEIIKDEAKMMGINIDNSEEELAPTQDEDDSEPQNVPQIGDEITLDDLSSDSSDNNDNTEQENDDADDNNDGSPMKKRRSNRSTYKLKKNEKGETPLHRYCIDGNFEQVERLIKLGHPINVHDHFGWLPLHEACNHGYVEIVQLLLQHRAAINDTKNQDKISPLHDACANGQLNVIEVLLNAGADVTLLNKFGQTAYELLQKLWRKSKDDVTDADRCMYKQICRQFTEKLNENENVISQLNVCDNDDDDSNSVDYFDTITQSPKAGPSNIQTINRNHEQLIYDNDSNDHDESPLQIYSTPVEASSSSFDEILAVTEYQNVMNNMGSRKKANEKISPQKRDVCQIKRPAFLDENEVGENWLDNDLLPNAKRQKFQSPRKQFNRTVSPIQSTSTTTTSWLREKPSIQINSDPDDSADDEISTRYVDAYDILMGSSNSSDGFAQRKSTKQSTSKKFASNKNQRNTLLDSGFVPTNLSSENTVSSSSSPSQEQHRPVVNKSPQKSISSKMSVIKVKIESHTLCVPIVNETIDNLNVGWLADEAARRYYNLKGIKPILRLCTDTDEKAIFEDSDPIAILLAESVIDSIVLDWNLPMLSQRYVESCIQLKQDIDPSISGLLPIVQATQKLVITNQCLKPITCKPLFKSINQQHLLTIIDLTNNFIEDEGLKYLCQSLSSLTHLNELNLSGNMISSIGIRYFSEMIQNQQQQQSLPELQRLTLNYNMLGNDSVPYLSKITQLLPKLQALELCSTDITELSSHDLKTIKLTSFDISFNTFTCTEFGKILKKLNFSILRQLNVGFCVDKNTNNVLGDIVSGSMNNGTGQCLEKINLSGLNLRDSDAYTIINAICRSTKLKEINFNDNLELTPVALQLLLERISVEQLFLENTNVLRNLSAFDCSIQSINVDVIYAKNLFFTCNSNELDNLKKLFYRLYDNRCNFKLVKRCHLHVQIALAQGNL